jgi:nicotinate phosphoribosyltransferase
VTERGAAPDDLGRDIAARTDVYFNRTRQVVMRFGDKRVTYALFLRRPVISAPRLMLEWLARVAEARGTTFDIDLVQPEGSWTGAGEPIAYITGSLVNLADLETILLQKIGPVCVAAHNAYQMWRCRRWASWQWKRATVPEPRCRR